MHGQVGANMEAGIMLDNSHPLSLGDLILPDVEGTRRFLDSTGSCSCVRPTARSVLQLVRSWHKHQLYTYAFAKIKAYRPLPMGEKDLIVCQQVARARSLQKQRADRD